ncbi:MAG: radical SAM protein [Candidatus Aminicenantes bacterium]|nr:radical SAM protein [Candidatus Aminicenantes bacterium]
MKPPTKGQGFEPREVLFSPLSACNLRCRHCSVAPGSVRLPVTAALRFLDSCRGTPVERIGFTGGEPFLYPSFLEAVSARAVRLGLLFDRITTNAVWFRTIGELRTALTRLRDKGYDGSFGVSLDAFHGTGVAKPAAFIRTAAEIWNRPDIAGVVAVRGVREAETEERLAALAWKLEARLSVRQGRRIIASDAFFIPVTAIDLVPLGRAADLVDPWRGAWFKEDFCRGPGHVFYVLPDGAVKPCCGYATDDERLTIGNIKHHTAADLIARAAKNDYVRAVFELGLTRIRQRLLAGGTKFPGRTANHCYFCHHLLTSVPRPRLDASLGSAR